jgi:DNA-binding Lrp family transcriptional regulator
MKENVKTFFFEATLKRWSFTELVKESGISRERVNYYLKKLMKEKFIRRIKPKQKMPYYITNRETSKFRFEKRMYGLTLLEQSGLFEHLSSLKEIKTAILFGSFARGDWNQSSDVDIFIYGDDKNFAKGEFEHKIKREIQVFSYKNSKEIKKELDAALIPTIAQGFNIKESLEPFEVSL